MYFHKNGIWLRKIEKEDLADLLLLKNESWWGTHNTLIVNLSDQEKWFNNLPSNHLFMMVLQEQEKLGIMSYTNIDWISRVCHVSGSAFRSASRSHSMIDCWHCCTDFAFEMLNMHRLEAECLVYNLVAQKLNIDTIHMQIEGKKRKSVFKCGKYYDSLVLGLLKEEWEQEERIQSYQGSCCLNFDHEKMDKLITRSKHV